MWFSCPIWAVLMTSPLGSSLPLLFPPCSHPGVTSRHTEADLLPRGSQAPQGPRTGHVGGQGTEGGCCAAGRWRLSPATSSVDPPALALCGRRLRPSTSALVATPPGHARGPLRTGRLGRGVAREGSSVSWQQRRRGRAPASRPPAGVALRVRRAPWSLGLRDSRTIARSQRPPDGGQAGRAVRDRARPAS